MLEVLRTEIAFAIKMNVNGKIDAISGKLDDHNVKHEKDMERMMPIIEKFEAAVQDVESAKRVGRLGLWLAGSVTVVGGAYLVLRQIFFNH